MAYIPKVNKKWKKSPPEILARTVASRINQGGAFLSGTNYAETRAKDEQNAIEFFLTNGRQQFEEKYINWLY